MAPRPSTTTEDALDDVFDNYMVESDEDPFRDLDTTLKESEPIKNQNKRKANKDDDDDGLGVNEEVKVTKKRKPAPKLDEARLLTQLGLPKLKSSFRSKLAPKLKGKGHEFSDAGKLLQFYQLWLDALYPRAKFADGLAMIEKVGHSKRMQVMRRTWIDEGKRRSGDYMDDDDYPATTRPEPVDTASRDAPQEIPVDGQQTTTSLFGNNQDNGDDLFLPETNKHPEEHNDVPSDDEFDMLFQGTLPIAKQTKVVRPRQDDSEGEDDLDALLAEEDARRSKPAPPTRRQPDIDEEDDLDALLAEGDARRPKVAPPASRQPEEEEDDDDLDALLAEQEADDRRFKNLARGTSSPLDTSDEEYLDALADVIDDERKANVGKLVVTRRSPPREPYPNPEPESDDSSDTKEQLAALNKLGAEMKPEYEAKRQLEVQDSATTNPPSQDEAGDDLDALLAESEQQPSQSQDDVPLPTKPAGVPNLAAPEVDGDGDDANGLLPSSSPVKDPERAELDLDGI